MAVLRQDRLAAGLVIIAVLAAAVGVRADACRLGLWADPARTAVCVTVAPGELFTWEAFAAPAAGQGLAYATFRLRIPPTVTLVGRPRLTAAASELIATPFADGTLEWNVIVTGCPADWTHVFSQDARVAGPDPAVLEIVAGDSLVRDCRFVLEGIEVAAVVRVNDPGCPVGAPGPCWGTLKSRFR